MKGSELTGAFTLVDAGKNPKKVDAWDKDDAGAMAGVRQTLAEVSFTKPGDKRLPDTRHVKLPPTEGRLQTQPPQVDSHGKLTQDFGGRVRKVPTPHPAGASAAPPTPSSSSGPPPPPFPECLPHLLPPLQISVKNFMLEDPNCPGRTVLLFGRVGKDTFGPPRPAPPRPAPPRHLRGARRGAPPPPPPSTPLLLHPPPLAPLAALDYAAPLNAVQAFAIAMTSFSELSRRFGRGIPG